MKNIFINKKKIIEKQFENRVGYKPVIENPKSFNEKIQWYKLYYRDSLMTQCADKWAVRKYVTKIIGEKYLIPILGVYNSVDDINFDELPNQFVLKVNHGSSQNIICKDKSKLNIENAKSQLSIWMKPESNLYNISYEWCYKNIKPKIICESLINISNNDLLDYKFFCFNGKVKIILVCSERSQELKTNFFDTNWNELPFTRFHLKNKKIISKPNRLKEMISISQKLSDKFPFVRIDLYEINKKIYFGEMTFYPGNGTEPFTPVEWDYKIGNFLRLPIKFNKNTIQSLQNNLISKEIHYGGKVSNIPRNKVSPKDPRSKEELNSGGMIGGDRMLHHSYSQYYAKYLLPYLKKTNISIVEVGILKGTGLAIWSDIFPNAKIFGFDIDINHYLKNIPNLKKQKAFKKIKPKVYNFDQFKNNKLLLKKLFSKNKINICIDDGFHSDKTAMNTFKQIKPYLSKDFIYFIEDNKTIYPEIRKKYPQYTMYNYGELTIIKNRNLIKKIIKKIFNK